MKNRIWTKAALFLVVFAVGACANKNIWQWAVHDMDRPQPPVVTPGKDDRLPPSDAIVLFDGTDLSAWQSARDGSNAAWAVRDGYMEVVAETGNILTRQSFGSCQLYIEWATPEEGQGDGQNRANSGVFLMRQYEVQILDSYDNITYPDGQAASIYGQSPPLVNASRKPGQWQSYNIIFRAPKFDGDTLIRPATITVLHNGVLVQDNWELEGRTFHKRRAEYIPHAEKMPIMLQDHGDLVRFRNIWVRPLED